MPDRTPRHSPPPSAFCLNLEQQKHRAKDLLRAAKAADPEALARISPARHATLKLADAQFVIARELRFASWAKLKAHIESMDRQRVAIDAKQPAPDGELKTLHIRCGSDIQNTLKDGGFTGDFLEHAIPYCLGPVATGADRHERMARFLVASFPDAKGGLVYGEELLHRSAEDYDRVVIWMEHDSWDQLVLVRLLSHYANAKRPRLLELIAVDAFPGAARYIGLGQLPEEALRLLWPTRKPVTAAQLALGHEAWLALASDNPTQLAAIARSGTPALPITAPALHRHLRELPSIENGLSLTERLALELLSESGLTLNQLFMTMTHSGREPLPFIGDLGFLHVIDDMLKAAEPVLIRTPPPAGERWFLQHLEITDLGRAVLRGERDWQSLQPPPRWVGGVHVHSSSGGWRWDETSREAIFRT